MWRVRTRRGERLLDRLDSGFVLGDESPRPGDLLVGDDLEALRFVGEHGKHARHVGGDFVRWAGHYDNPPERIAARSAEALASLYALSAGATASLYAL